MNTEIKQFKPEQYSLLKSWWDFYKEQAPQLDMLPETSYVMYFENKPILSVSLFLTNTPLAWVDNFIGNPELKGDIRRKCSELLLNHLETVAKEYKKDRLFCMSINKKTSERYSQLGFIATAKDIVTFVKGVK